MKPYCTLILFLSVFMTSGINSAQNRNIINDTIINNKFQSIERSVNYLKSQNDSLNKELRAVKNNDYKSFEVIDRVNNYYENAWNKLIYFITAIGGIIVFVIPFILSRLQKRELRLNKEEFEEYVDNKIVELEKRIINFNTEEINKIRIEIENLNKEINQTQDEEIAKVYAMTYYLQGLHSKKSGNPDLTIKSFIISAEKLLRANVDGNLKLTLQNIILAIDKKIQAKEKLTENSTEKLNKLIVEINEKFPESFVDETSELKEKITTANNV